MKKIIFLIILLVVLTSSADATWYDETYEHKVDNAIPNGVRPYQLLINVSNATGTNTDLMIYCNGRCNSDFSDLNFTLDDTTLLSFWIKNVTTGEVFVNVTANGVVNMYYDKRGAVSGSSGNNTFLFFDDFLGSAIESTKWNTVNALGGAGSTLTISNSRMKLTAAVNNGKGIVSKTTKFNTTNNSIETKDFMWEAAPTTNYYSQPFVFQSDNTHHVLDGNVGQGYGLWQYNDTNYRIMRINGVSYTALDTVTSAIVPNQVKTTRFAINNTNVSSYLNGDRKVSKIDVTYRNNMYVGSYAYALGSFSMDAIFVRSFSIPEPNWTTWSASQSVFTSGPVITIINNSKKNGTGSFGIFLNVSESIRYFANTTQPTNDWHWYVDGTLQSNNSNNFTTSFTAGTYHYVYVNATNSNEDLSNTVYWGNNVYPALATSPADDIELLNDTPAEDFATAIEDNDMQGLVNAPVEVYVNIIGISFYAVIWFIVFGMLWIKQQSINIPAIIGVIFGGIIITFLPAQYQLVSQVLIVFGIFAAIYVFYKGRG